MKRALTALVCATLLLTSCVHAAPSEEGTMTLYTLNVGKADCLLLASGDSLYMIDTGTVESFGAVSRALHSMGISRLSGVILTHADSDHTGGAWALASSDIAVDAWYASAFCAKIKKMDKHPAAQAAALRGEAVTWLRAGDTLPLDGGTLTVLAPAEMSNVENCNSLVLLCEGGGGRMLLTGDMEFPEEEPLLLSASLPVCDVLKVANHGERDATSDVLVSTVRPKVAVISTSTAEEPDTPAPRVLKALRSVNAEILMTQHSPLGIRVTLRDGSVSAEVLDAAVYPDAASGIRISEKSVDEQLIRLTNRSDQPVDLSGWFIRSTRGKEMFVFPSGALLAPGGSLTVTSLSTTWQGDYTWRETKVWHRTKDDTALLYDAYGRLMDQAD